MVLSPSQAQRPRTATPARPRRAMCRRPALHRRLNAREQLQVGACRATVPQTSLHRRLNAREQLRIVADSNAEHCKNSPSQAQRPRTATISLDSIGDRTFSSPSQAQRPRTATLGHRCRAGITDELSIAGSTPANSYATVLADADPALRSPSQAQRPRTATPAGRKHAHAGLPLSIAGSTPANSYRRGNRRARAGVLSLHRRLNAREQLRNFRVCDIHLCRHSPSQAQRPRTATAQGLCRAHRQRPLSIAGSTPANSYVA